MKKIIYYGKVPNWKLRKHYNKCKEKETTEEYEEAMLALKAIIENNWPAELYIPEGITKIGNNGINLSSAEIIHIPDSVTEIASNAIIVHRSSNLTIIIGTGITSIGTYAFGDSFDNYRGVTLVIKATTPPLMDYLFPREFSGNTEIYVPDESVDAYKLALYGKVGDDVIKPLSEFIE